MRWLGIVAGGAFALLAVAAGAGPPTLELGAEAAVGWDSNVASSSRNEQDDVIFRIGPRLTLEDRDGRVEWSLEYAPDYNDYLDFSQLDAWDHDVRAEVDWQVDPRTNLVVRDRYLDFSTFARFNEQGGDVDAALGLDLQGIERNVLDVELTRQFSRGRFFGFYLNATTNDFEEDARVDNRSASARLAYSQAVTPTDTLGGFVRYLRQRFERPVGDDSRTDFVNFSLTWVHRFSPTLQLTVAGGPTWVMPESQSFEAEVDDARFYPIIRSTDGSAGPVMASTCPRLDDGTAFITAECEVFDQREFVTALQLGDLVNGTNDLETFNETGTLSTIGPDSGGADDSLTYFAQISLVKTWRSGRLSLNYLRDEANSSGIGTSTLRDTVYLQGEWNPSPRWRFSATLRYERRETATDAATLVRAVTPTTLGVFDDVGQAVGFRTTTVENDLQANYYTLTTVVTYRWTERVSFFWRVFASRQDLDRTINSREVDRLRTFVGVTAHLDPIPLGI